jgi:tetratricopeptide (TPR) repeat protein
VAYIVQRMASLATLFVLLSLLCYVFATQSGNRRKSFLLYALSGISVIAGIFSKENAVMAIPLVLIYDYIFLSRFKWILFRKRMLVVFGMGILSIGTAFALLKMYPAFLDVARLFFSPTQPMTAKSWMAGDVYWTPLQHILTELRVISRYLFLILIPLPQFLIFDWWGFTVSKSLTEPITTLFSITAVISLVIFAIWKIKRFPMLCFGILWYFSAISLESFFALGSDLYFEHRNYLPSAGLFIGIAGQITISLRTKLNQKAVFTAIIICGLILGLLTFSRNFVWKDSITLWGDTLRKVPSNIRAMMAMGNAHFKLSDMGTAERYYKEALRASSRDQRLHYLDDSVYSLGMLYLFTGKLQEARDLIKKYEKSIESYRPKILKGFYMASNNDIDEALVTYKEVLDKARGVDSVVLHTLMGDAYRKKGLWDKALEEYGEAILLDPGFSAAYYGTGVVLMNKRDIVRAHEYFEKTLSIDPDNVLALSDMADLMLIRKENSREALNYAERAVSKNPSFYQPYLTMGNVLIVLGREQEAEEFYKKAVEYGLADYMVPFSKARAYYMKGDEEQAQRQLAELGKFKNLPDKMRELIREQR